MTHLLIYKTRTNSSELWLLILTLLAVVMGTDHLIFVAGVFLPLPQSLIFDKISVDQDIFKKGNIIKCFFLVFF